MEETKKELTLDELTNISKDLTNMYDVHVEGFPFILQLGNFNIFIDQQDKDEEIAFVSIDGLNVIFVPLAKVVKIYQTCENETIILELEDNKRILLLKIPTDQSAAIIDESYKIEKYKHNRKKNQLKFKSNLKKSNEFIFYVAALCSLVQACIVPFSTYPLPHKISDIIIHCILALLFFTKAMIRRKNNK